MPNLRTYQITTEQFEAVKSAVAKHKGSLEATSFRLDGVTVGYGYSGGELTLLITGKGVLHALVPDDLIFDSLESALGLPKGPKLSLEDHIGELFT